METRKWCGLTAPHTEAGQPAATWGFDPMYDPSKPHAATTPFFDAAISATWIAFLAVLGVNVIINVITFGTPLAPKEITPPAKFGYPVEALVETGASDAAPERTSSLPLVAASTVQAGEAVFRKCQSCHDASAGGPNKTGPNLHNIVGDKVGDRNGFQTTESLKSIGGEWTYEKLDDYIENPKRLAPKGSMSFIGLPKNEDRAAVIRYLMSQTDNPPPLPAAPPPEAAKPAADAAKPAGAAPAAAAPAKPAAAPAK